MCCRSWFVRVILSVCAWLFVAAALPAQPGSVNEPIRYVGGATVRNQSHDGQLRPAIGVESFQILRANRTHPELADHFGWTYNHAPMIAYWNGRFFVEYLSNPVGEHIAPGQTLLSSSADGRHWDAPKVIFPIYKLQRPDPPGGTAMMHQRMAFFIAPDGRLLAMAFYGHAPDPFGPGGIGRVVREIHKDGSFGPIYFLRYNTRSGWGESNTAYPSYKHAKDAGFIQACDAFFDNRLMREQFWDEEQLFEGDFFAVKSHGSQEAFNWYHRKDGKLVGLWKWSMAALSSDEGRTWSRPVKVPTLRMTGAKISGRRTSDGRYALVYNPNVDDDHRWPLAMVTGDDGVLFDNILCIQGEVPPRRFAGRYKDFGSQYNRIVEEGNGQTPGSDLWVTYSMNKEDIWVSRVPVPVRDRVTGPVHDTFDGLDVGGPVTDWNIYCPQWAPVRVAAVPSAANKSLELSDKDPYDYARAVRVFPESKSATVQFKLHAGQNVFGRLEIEVTDRFGARPVRLIFAEDGQIKLVDGTKPKDLAAYHPDHWYEVTLQVDVPKGRFEVSLDGKPVAKQALFAESVQSVEQISFRTGEHREEPTLTTSTDATPDRVSPNPDVPQPPAIFHIDDVTITPGDSAASTTAGASVAKFPSVSRPVKPAKGVRQYVKRPLDWYTSPEARCVAANILSFQSDSGGWPKNVDTTAAAYTGNRDQLKATFDNGATTDELRVLARMYNATHDEQYRNAFDRGLTYILKAQYANGGWPQFFPSGRKYARYITFNDDAMVRLMRLLQEITQSKAYDFVDAERHAEVRQAFDRGVQCILKCQVEVAGKPTAWCAQHDEIDFRPRPARSYELVSLSGAESVEIVRLLMSLDSPSPQVVQSIEAAVAWFEAAKLPGIRQEERADAASPKGWNKVVVTDPSAPPMWARFYEIGTNRPIFSDRDGVAKHDLAEIGYERRNGYAWLGYWPQRLLATEYPAWRKKWVAGTKPAEAVRP
jgi:PelA/Pel-15E family pectate lyase